MKGTRPSTMTKPFSWSWHSAGTICQNFATRTKQKHRPVRLLRLDKFDNCQNLPMTANDTVITGRKSRRQFLLAPGNRHDLRHAKHIKS